MSSGLPQQPGGTPCAPASGPKAEAISLFPCSQPSSPRRTGMEVVVTAHPTRLGQLAALGTTKKINN